MMILYNSLIIRKKKILFSLICQNNSNFFDNMINYCDPYLLTKFLAMTNEITKSNISNSKFVIYVIYVSIIYVIYKCYF